MLKNPPILPNPMQAFCLFLWKKITEEKSLCKVVDTWRKLYEISKEREDVVWILQLLGFIKREVNNGVQGRREVKVNILELDHSVTL